MDFFGCFVGIWAGMHTVRYFDGKTYEWVGISRQPNIMGRVCFEISLLCCPFSGSVSSISTLLLASSSTMAISGTPFGLRTIYPSLKFFTMFIYAGAKEFFRDNIENVAHGRPKLPSF